MTDAAERYSSAEAREAARSIRERIGAVQPRIAIILGSGLGTLTDDMRDTITVPYAEIPGFPSVSVLGHAGRLVVGTLAGVPVVAFSGRFHMYEGNSPQLTGFPVRVAHALGASVLFVANAAGGINRDFMPGDLMMIGDHLNLMFVSPLTGPQQDSDERFPDMSDPYDHELREILTRVAAEQNIVLRSGVYVGHSGPEYETRAEIRMYAMLGGDAVGMSTIPEVITARAVGMRVAGVSCITNMACGITDERLDHATVLRAAAQVEAKFRVLVGAFVGALPATQSG